MRPSRRPDDSRQSGRVFALSPHGPAGSSTTAGNADRAVLYDFKGLLAVIQATCRPLAGWNEAFGAVPSALWAGGIGGQLRLSLCPPELSTTDDPAHRRGASATEPVTSHAHLRIHLQRLRTRFRAPGPGRPHAHLPRMRERESGTAAFAAARQVVDDPGDGHAGGQEARCRAGARPDARTDPVRGEPRSPRLSGARAERR